MPDFGRVGVLESFVLTVDASGSAPFPVPQGFVGHLYVHAGGNRQAIFEVGSDGNAVFTPNGGFVKKVNHNEMATVELQAVAGHMQWRFILLPERTTKISVAMVGAKQPQ